MNKSTLTELLAVVAICSLAATMGSPLVMAQTTTPSAPEFTVEFEAHPYEEPPIYEIDQYTGENVTVREGFHVENQSAVVTIKNQPFVSSFNGITYYLRYFVWVKGHFGEKWTNFCSLDQSSSEKTVCSKSIDYPSGAQLDFRVMAAVSHSYEEYEPPVPPFSITGQYVTRNATDATSEWSNTQTITIPEPSTSTSPPTATLAPTLSQTPAGSQLPNESAAPTSSEVPNQPKNQGISRDEFYMAISVLVVVIGTLSASVVVLAREVKKVNSGVNMHD
ncbi:MAG: hypothetical protein NWF00_01150 [Candidatus Bathyarchaeota archaeon]|nr:hypothetical protein [Candidatus Bathyarchaeota archaeon]